MSALQKDAFALLPGLVRDEAGQWRFDVRVHTGLASAERAWRQIETEGHCTPFQRLDWARTIIDNRIGAMPGVLFVIELFDGETGRPLIVMPLVRRSHGLYTALTWLGADVCDYCAPLFANIQWTPVVALAAWRAIRKALPLADVLQIDHVPSYVSGVLNPFLLLGRTRTSATTTCGLQVCGDPQTVLERCCDPSFVKKLGKTGRRLAARGPVRFVEARTPAEVNEIFDALLVQRLSRFRKLDRFDLIDQPHIAAFYRAAAIEGLNGGAVRLLGLRVGDEWVGTYYGLMHGGAYQGLIVTMAGGSWKTCSPGLHVHAHVIRWVAAQGLHYFDMSVGPASYKDQIGGRRSALYKVDHALSLWGGVILLGLRGIAAAKEEVRARPRLHAALRAMLDTAEDLARTVRSIELLPWRKTARAKA